MGVSVEYDLNVLSFGAGVQSTAVLLMAEEGRFGEPPDCAIFADTHGEPDGVYEHLEQIIAMVSMPVHIVSKGDLKQHVLDVIPGNVKNSHAGPPPFYAKNQEGKAGMLWRKCTHDYKIKPLHQKIRKILGYEKGQRVKKRVRQWFGISVDEAQRMRDSRVPWMDNYYPLIEADLSRIDCEKYLENKGITPKKSACWFCPYTTQSSWAKMRREEPNEFAKAVEFDGELRKYGRLPYMKGDVYLHRNVVPLAEAVNRDTPEDQFSLDFDGECEGMCGV